MSNQIKYFDNEAIRSISSPDFNFVLDKDSGVSICWGQTENEDPNYDPISPQEICFEINQKTILLDLINNFNILTDVRYKPNQKDFQNIPFITEDNKNIINDPSVTTMSTITNIQLNICTKQINLDICSNFISYLKKFNVKTFIQFNNPITEDIINKLKFITSNIIIVYNEQMIETYKKLLANNFNVDIKLFVNNDNFIEIKRSLNELDKKTKGILYFRQKISKEKLVEIEGRIKNLKLNIFLNSCNLYLFNTDKQIYLHNLQIINCDCTTFSIYVKNNKLYSCPFNSKSFCTINDKSIKSKLWYNKTLCQFRNKIIDNSYCVC